ncbi:MAG: M3 family oligoendopeptidase [Alphaproteobacteria bacterium]|nr:M3 family oligoendopeptidase [Alphaproteobacteria bacterium]
MAKKKASTKKKQKLPTWDLTHLYTGIDDRTIVRDIAQIAKESAAFAKDYQKKVKSLNAPAFAEAIKRYEKLSDAMGKLGSYAQLLYAGDMANPAITQFYQNTSETLTLHSSKLVFFTLEINSLSDEQLNKHFKASKIVAHYKPWLASIRSYKPYQLNDALERFIHENSVTIQSWTRLYDESNARLEFKVNGKKLANAEVFDLLSGKDAKLRKAAAKEIARVYQENAPLFTLITNTLAKAKQIEDDTRKFARPISSRNVSNQVEDEVVDALIKTVKANYKNLSHRYYKWKAKQFGKKKLDYWDRNAPLPKMADGNIPWPKAVNIVMDAYEVFSPTLADVGQQFFEGNWIDVPARKSKASGAFAHPTVPSAHPYLLLNYLGKTRDVMTLAHELGHGVHQVLSASQGALMCDTPLTLAETASVFGEMLTFQSMLSQEKDKKKRRAMIASKVEDMLNTVVRQVAFCEFERMVHDERKLGELSTKRIGEIWMQVQSESLGPAIQLHPEYNVYWMYIPHFIHTPFYVYAYAFGDCLVNSLYGVYQKEKSAGRGVTFADKYVDMLAAGGTLRHKELLKPFGLDASKSDFWQQGLDVISQYIDELV